MSTFSAFGLALPAVVALNRRMRQLIAAAARRIVAFAETLDGYEQPELVDEIFRKTAAYHASGAWPEMAGVSSVLDFGGACGQHYKLACLTSPAVRWAIVETPAMVSRAKELATDRLQFFVSITEAAAWLGAVDVMHSSGALQYAPNPEQILSELCGVRAKAMHWDRLALAQDHIERDSQLSLLSDNGPATARGFRWAAVRYARTKIPEHTFLAEHHAYDLIERGKDRFSFRLAR